MGRPWVAVGGTWDSKGEIFQRGPWMCSKSKVGWSQRIWQEHHLLLLVPHFLRGFLEMLDCALGEEPDLYHSKPDCS